MNKKGSYYIHIVYILLLTAISNHGFAATRAVYETSRLKVRISTNAPQPISAFYEGRGFSKPMIDVLRQQCFVSVFIQNKSNDFIWLDLSKWQFSDADGQVKRLDRDYWKKQWQKMNIPLSHQSTFRWTLLPEKLDFHPSEREGGNIILPRTGKPFSVQARFATGAEANGPVIDVKFEHIECATDR